MLFSDDLWVAIAGFTQRLEILALKCVCRSLSVLMQQLHVSLHSCDTTLLYGHTLLLDVNLSHSQTNDNSLPEFVDDAAKMCHLLHTLTIDLSDNSHPPLTTLSATLTSIHDLAQMRVLSLDLSRLSACDGLAYDLAVLREYPLAELDLNLAFNCISDEGARELATLGESATLQMLSLNVAHNCISVSGATALCSLRDSTALQKLSVRFANSGNGWVGLMCDHVVTKDVVTKEDPAGIKADWLWHAMHGREALAADFLHQYCPICQKCWKWEPAPDHTCHPTP